MRRRQERAEGGGEGRAAAGLGLIRLGERGAQGQGFREQAYRECLEKCKGLQASQLVRSGDLAMMMMRCQQLPFMRPLPQATGKSSLQTLSDFILKMTRCSLQQLHLRPLLSAASRSAPACPATRLKLDTWMSPDALDSVPGVGGGKHGLECDMLAVCLPQAHACTN